MPARDHSKIWVEVGAELVIMHRWSPGAVSIPGHLHTTRRRDEVTGKEFWYRELIANLSSPIDGADLSYRPLHPILNTLHRPLILDQMKFKWLELGANPNSEIRYGIETEEGPLGPYTTRVSEIAVR